VEPVVEEEEEKSIGETIKDTGGKVVEGIKEKTSKAWLWILIIVVLVVIGLVMAKEKRKKLFGY
jgi:hypothetical protein|tara:strand:- start:10332 stop:10523 length:192 start_codon:yes stop_codon:yes gene_type:complete